MQAKCFAKPALTGPTVNRSNSARWQTGGENINKSHITVGRMPGNSLGENACRILLKICLTVDFQHVCFGDDAKQRRGVWPRFCYIMAWRGAENAWPTNNARKLQFERRAATYFLQGYCQAFAQPLISIIPIHKCAAYLPPCRLITVLWVKFSPEARPQARRSGHRVLNPLARIRSKRSASTRNFAAPYSLPR